MTSNQQSGMRVDNKSMFSRCQIIDVKTLDPIAQAWMQFRGIS